MVKDKLTNLFDFLWNSLASIETTMDETLSAINEFKKSIKKARDDLRKIKPSQLKAFEEKADESDSLPEVSAPPGKGKKDSKQKLLIYY